ncbi:chemotaxis protein CheA [Vibrio variabilis]|uniref:chemotaxis protein CheA n=1 Tax=Vibrio variabilis TaxID=990271 RepID=UPI000DD8FB86|nr:chemotaxis protein CheA [Vibrio variabilis]
MSESNQQFELIFFEEMAEHLEEMESLLLEMNQNDDESDLADKLNAIFRAVHSIKGGSGIFGFDDITHVSHVLENLLDKLRNHQITLTQAVVDALLNARDLLDVLKGSYQTDHDSASFKSQITTLCDELQRATVSPETPPANSEAAPFSTNAPLSAAEKSTIKVLLVEDSQVIQKVASFTLNKIGFRSVEVAENGEHALEILKASQDEPFQLILLDCQMPVMDGYQATEKIRQGAAGETHKSVTIIAMTAMTGDEEQQRCIETGMDDYLLKPMKAGLVEKKINQWRGKILPNPEPALSPTSSSQPKKTDSNQRVIHATKSLESASIRVSTQKVDQLINQVGELIITQSMLQKLTFDLGLNSNELLAGRLSQLEANTRDLQATVMSVRMMPIGTVFGRFPRIVRDLSHALNKQIRLNIEGEQTQLDKGLLEMLVDPLTHLVRNSIDHGIESPEQRAKLNKPPYGTITLSAVYRGGDVIVHVDDDGAGIDPQKILDKAKNNGLTLPQNISEQDIFQLIFSAGFSTAEQVTEVSGRGVGMDVVKRNIASMGGSVEVKSNLGTGTRMSIRLPLTLAILEGMSINVGDHVYIIPLSNIVESLQAKEHSLKRLNSGETMIKVHEDYIPVLRLHNFFNLDTDITDLRDGIMVLIEHGSKTIALFVDSLLGQQQVVVKNLEHNFRKIPCVSGATIMGDGRVSLILDVADLVRQSDTLHRQ